MSISNFTQKPQNPSQTTDLFNKTEIQLKVMKNEKLLEFLNSSVFAKSNPAYKSLHLHISRKNSKNDIVLPALILPVVPKNCHIELQKSIHLIDGNTRNNKQNSVLKTQNLNAQQELFLDGIPYNSTDYCQLSSTKEKQNLHELVKIMYPPVKIFKEQRSSCRSISKELGQKFSRRSSVQNDELTLSYINSRKQRKINKGILLLKETKNYLQKLKIDLHKPKKNVIFLNENKNYDAKTAQKIFESKLKIREKSDCILPNSTNEISIFLIVRFFVK